MPVRLIRRIGVIQPTPPQEQEPAVPAAAPPPPVLAGVGTLGHAFQSLGEAAARLMVSPEFRRLAFASAYGMSSLRANQMVQRAAPVLPDSLRPYVDLEASSFSLDSLVHVGIDYAGVEARAMFFDEITPRGLFYRSPPPPRRDARLEAKLAEVPVRCTSGLDDDVFRFKPVVLPEQKVSDAVERVAHRERARIMRVGADALPFQRLR